MQVRAPLAPLMLLMLLAGCEAAATDTDRVLSANGEVIALSGGAGGAANACFTCHGLDGGGDGAAAPRLAGLHLGYLQKQMEDYASGLRADDQMTRIAKALDQRSRREVAAYYAALPIPASARTHAAAPAPSVYLRGDPARGVVACAACHGLNGEGTGLGGNPQIAGQPYPYLVEQMERWKSGERRNDPRGVMAAAVKPLSDLEVRAIGLWLSAQPASPAPASASATGSASVDAAARPAASRETRRPDRSDGA